MWPPKLRPSRSIGRRVMAVESYKPGLIHFALNDPSYAPMTSSLTSSEIPITQPYPDVIVDLRVTVRVRVRARG